MYTLRYSGLGEIPQVPKGSGSVGFACTTTFCYTSGAKYSGLFQRFQRALNIVAQVKGIRTQVAVDGQIGASTVSLSKVIADKLSYGEVPRLFTLHTLEGGGGITKETLAKYADVITPELESFAYKMSPSSVGTSEVSPQANVPYGTGPGSTPTSIGPYPDVMPQGTSVPTVPGVSPWGLTPNTAGGYSVPSAGPQITMTPPSVNVAPQVILPSKGPSAPLIAGVTLLGAGALAAILYTINKKKGF